MQGEQALAVEDGERGAARDVYGAVRRAALSSWQPPGSLISESALARWCGTSRTPVREALARLCGEGFVERIDARGYVTAPISETRIRDIGHFHAYLEGVAAGTAAQLPVRERGDALLALVERHGAIANLRCGDAWDVEFHLEITTTIGNRLLTDAVANSFAHLQRFIAFIPGSAAFIGHHSNDEHRLIAQAIADADAGLARDTAERHALEVSETLVGLLRSAPPHPRPLLPVTAARFPR